ncbi:zinc finger CCCH domain-containing protein 65 isoform X2 [Oryza brachyantha]|uniref:C3H1-type domain-containing protein n=1 Tax=Oryza brachyantha TaxID=4533 RepID=J3NCM3_ORYBR|nr:zinc finger CCCH domain-containing protein 65 isoform X2 [Oryza brachyantha]
MADADARAPPKSDPDATPIGSISPSSRSSAAAAFEEVEELLTGLAVADRGDLLLLPKPTGWEDGPADGVGGGGGEDSGEKLPGEVSAAEAEGGGGGGGAAADSRPRFPRRPGEPDCTYYVKFGSCRFGMKCKFNHPARKKKSRVKGSNGGSGSGSNSSSNKASSPDDEQAPKEEYGSYVPDISVEADSLVFADKGSTSNSENFKKKSYEIIDVKKVRVEPKELKVAKEKRKEFISEVSSQEECKYYSTPGGCKYGKSCKYLHRAGKEGKTDAEKVDLNFLGLPLRPGEKECPYYMRTGSCKYATNCKFHHPDPSNVGSKDPQLEHDNVDTPQQDVQGSSSQPNASIWPDQRTVNEHHVPYLAPSPSYGAGMLPPQGMYPPPEWNGYHQVPLNPYYPPGVPFQHFPAPINHPMYKPAEIPGHQQAASEEYPERPGQPECQYFVKSGFCKFRMKCKYHHPRSPVPLPAGALSPLGLPIKPDQPVCTYYGRYGVCKFGPACAYNHPFNFGPVPAAGPPLLPAQYPTPGNYTL